MVLTERQTPLRPAGELGVTRAAVGAGPPCGERSPDRGQMAEN